MSDAAIEQEIQAKGLTVPRITPADIEANIIGEYYCTASDAVEFSELAICSSKTGIEWDSLSLLTFCILVLKNGYVVTGESACASAENFDAELGRKIARQNAVAKVWPLMGYWLKQRIANIDALIGTDCPPDVAHLCAQMMESGSPAASAAPSTHVAKIVFDPHQQRVVAVLEYLLAAAEGKLAENAGMIQ